MQSYLEQARRMTAALAPNTREQWRVECELASRSRTAALALVRRYRAATGHLISVAECQRVCKLALIILDILDEK